jgi:hypothetical protein
MMKTVLSTAVVAAMFATGVAFASEKPALPEIPADLPKLSNPDCGAGKPCPDFKVGFVKDGKAAFKTEAEAKAMSTIYVSNVCRTNYGDCYLGGWFEIGLYCECTDGYYAYPGIVF